VELEDLAARLPVKPIRHSGSGTTGSFDLDQWISDHCPNVRGPSDWKGGRRWIFPTCPWNSDHDNGSAYILQFPAGAIAAGCLHNGCRGKDWHSLRDLVDPTWRPNSRLRGGAGQEPECAGWEVPLPFHQFNLPRFPTEALPGWLRVYVLAVATATQTPVDLAAILALAVVAASCAKKVEVRLKPGYVEPLNIFGVVALEPGARKTSVFRKIVEPLEEYERAEIDRLAPEIARAKALLKIKEAKLKKLQDRAVSAKGAEQNGLTAEAVALATEITESVVPTQPRYFADDCTPERLATLLRDQGGRIAVMSPEGDVFDLMAGRYSPTGAGNFGVYLKGHAGDALRIDRVGRPPEFIERPALTVGLAVQPEVIRGLIDRPGFRGRGLLGRFLYSIPISLLGHRDTNPPPIPEKTHTDYRSNIHALLKLPFEKEESGEVRPRQLRLASDAQTRFQAFDAWIEPQLSEFGDLGGIRDWGGKVVGAVGRIAGILHMADFVGTAAPWDHPISRETIDNAVQIGEYLIPHARAAFAEMGADVFVDQAKMVLRWIERNTPACFTKRDLHQAMRGTFKRVEELERPLALLVSHGFVRKHQEVSQDGPGRPASPIYDVNPLWVSEKAGRAKTRPARNQHSEDCENSEKGDAGDSSRPKSVQLDENAELE